MKWTAPITKALTQVLFGSFVWVSSACASGDELRLGQTTAFSGPASAYRTIAMVELAYIKMINEQGGIGGRRINLIALDDGYSPPKTFEQTRKLVENDNVLAILNPLGTPTGLVVRKYLNDKGIPQLFVGGGATLWGDHKRFPWSMGFQPSYQAETAVYAQHTLALHPDGKVALFYQNDDAGKDYANGFKAGLGAENSKRMIVAEATYEPGDPSVDSQIVKLRASGANVLFMHAIPKQAAQAIRKVHEIGWKPDLFFLAATSTSVSGVLAPAGFDAAKGIISAAYQKDPTDPQWADDPAVRQWTAFMKKYYPEGNLEDQLNVYGYTVVQAAVKVLENAAPDFSRKNIMKQATSMNFSLPMLLPGVRVRTSGTDYFPIESQQLQRFNGKSWELFGNVVSAEH